ncbi:MAG: hypothetical protein K2W95_24875 [Candidatus Obscuribacterales bacterium]|nr:hypothetical protein [Candidatus Obscuribacterales bacterium]
MHMRNDDMELFESKQEEQLCASLSLTSEDLSKENPPANERSAAASEALVSADVLPALDLSTGERSLPNVKDVNEDIYKKLAEEIGRTGKIPDRLKEIFKNSDPTAAQFELDKLNELLKPKGMRVDHDPKTDSLDLYQGGKHIDRCVFGDSTPNGSSAPPAREKVDGVKTDSPTPRESEIPPPIGDRNPTDAPPKRGEPSDLFPPVKVKEVDEDVYKKLAEEIGRTGKIPDRLKKIFENSDPTAAQFELDKLNELLTPKGMSVHHDPKTGRLDLYQGIDRIDRCDLSDANPNGISAPSAREKVDAVGTDAPAPRKSENPPIGESNPTQARPKITPSERSGNPLPSGERNPTGAPPNPKDSGNSLPKEVYQTGDVRPKPSPTLAPRDQGIESTMMLPLRKGADQPNSFKSESPTPTRERITSNNRSASYTEFETENSKVMKALTEAKVLMNRSELLKDIMAASEKLPDYVVPRGKELPGKQLSDSDLIKKGKECAEQWRTNPDPRRMQISEQEVDRLKKLDPKTWKKLDDHIQMRKRGYIG